jgi:replicative DNA helicase
MPSPEVELPPQAVEAEMAVLGAMLISKEALDKAAEFVDEEMFYKEAHRRIFKAMMNLHARRSRADIVTVGEELRAMKAFGDVGGSLALKELIDKVSTAAHVEHYARIVRDKAVLRELIRTATELVRECHEGSKDVQEILADAGSRVLKVAQKQQARQFSHSKALAHQVIDELERLSKNRDEIRGVPSGFSDLDKLTSGFQKGDLILIAARPGQGKTSLALNIAANAVMAPKRPVPTAFFSMEMSSRDLMMRLMASEAGVNVFSVRNAVFPRERWAHLTSAAQKFSEAPLWIDDSSSLNVLQVRARANRMAYDLAQQGSRLGLVIIDYLQLMQGGSRRAENRQQEVAEISRGLKQLARDLDIPVIALAQLNRKTEEKGRSDARPQISDLRESGALEQDADLVAMIFREGMYKRDDPSLDRKAELIIGKHRNGPTGTVPLVFLREFTRFQSQAKGEGAPPEDESEGAFE